MVDGEPVPPTLSEMTAMKTRGACPCVQSLHWIALASIAAVACNSGGGLRSSATDGSAGDDDALGPIINLGDVPADETAAVDLSDLSPQCCSKGEVLSPVAPETPCAFLISEPPPYPDDIAVYLNRYLVEKDVPDGWTFGPTTSTIVFTGASCDTITSSPQDSVVQLLCVCVPYWPCPGCWYP